MTRSLTRSASLAVFAAAICAAGSGVAGAAAPNAVTPFEVCSPLGCTVQRVTGTVETSTGFTRVRGSATDRSENAQLTVRLQVVDLNGTGRSQTVEVDDGTTAISTTFVGSYVTLRVSACAVPPGSCNTRSIPLG